MYKTDPRSGQNLVVNYGFTNIRPLAANRWHCQTVMTKLNNHVTLAVKKKKIDFGFY